MILTKTLKMLIGSAAAVALTASATLAADNAWDDVKERGTIRVGIIADQPCYYWRDNAQSPWKGFPIRFGEAATKYVGEKMGKELKTEFVPTSWSTVVLDIQSAKIDMFMGMGFTEERKKAINMFGPIYAVPEVYVTRKGFDPKGTGENTLDKLNTSGTRISVVMGTTEEQAAMSKAPKATLRALKTGADTILDVQSNNSDVILMTIINALFAVKANDNLNDPVNMVPYSATPSGGGTRKDGDERLYKTLQEWSEQYRASGAVREAIVGALDECGIDINRMPADTQF